MLRLLKFLNSLFLFVLFVSFVLFAGSWSQEQLSANQAFHSARSVCLGSPLLNFASHTISSGEFQARRHLADLTLAFNSIHYFFAGLSQR